MSEAAAPPVTRPNGHRWLKVALIASLALNALVIGVVVRTAWQFRAFGFIGPPGPEVGLTAFVDSLPRDRRDMLRGGVLSDRQRQLRPLRLEVRRARSDVARALAADPFDKAALVKAQSAALEAEINLRRAVQSVVPDIAERMTLDERRALATWRGRQPGRGPGGGPGGRGPRGDGVRGDGPRNDGAIEAGQGQRPPPAR